MKRLLQRLIIGKPAYKAGTLYRKHKPRWQAVSVGDALNISLRYGFRAVAWGKW